MPSRWKPEEKAVCVACGARDVGVIETRPSAHGQRRRRQCFACRHRWTTYEVHADLVELLESAVNFVLRASAAVKKHGNTKKNDA